MRLCVVVLLLSSCFCIVAAWDSEELEIFDLVEEVNTNFYDFLEISQNATNQQIKRAFRGLSIILHPDKNPSEDANVKFRNLVSIYEVLKDTSKREKYDKVLKDGLPNWKSALYYYRRMRKIGLYEGSFILFVIFTIGQYLFQWAAYLEKKYTAEQVIGSKLKKLQKKNKNVDVETFLGDIPGPSVLNTLPFQIPLAIWHLPGTIKNALYKANELKEAALEKRRLELEEAKKQEQYEKQVEEQVRLRKENKENLRKRKQNAKAPEKTEEDLRGYSRIQGREITEDDAVKPVTQKTTLSGGFWTDEDLLELIRLVKKYPSGSSSRWDTIAEAMNRSVPEVTFMAAKMKESGYRIPGHSDSVAENILQETQEIVKKEKVKKTVNKDIILPEASWTQEQQRALEAAIIKYRKNATTDRWQKISNCVPGKTKEECLVRYKYLCDLVKSQKQKLENEEKNREELTSSSSATIDSEKSPVTKKVTFTESTINIHTEPEDVEEEEEEEEVQPLEVHTTKKRSKRAERRRRKDLSSGEDSDDAYQYEMQ